MARPIKKGVDYFSHDTSHGKTLDILEAEFGNDGYAFWFKTLELLGKEAGLFYDCNNASNWRFLVSKTHVSRDTATEILELLCELEAIDTELWHEGKIIWCQNFVDRLDSVYAKRKEKTPVKPSLRSENDSTGEVTEGESTQSKVNKSKEKKKKNYMPNGTDYQDIFDHYLSLELIKHKALTQEMKNAIDIAKRRGGYSDSDLKMLLSRHKDMVKLTEGDGDFKVRKRGITEFFGQKVRDGTALICSEYADEGAKRLRYLELIKGGGSKTTKSGSYKNSGVYSNEESWGTQKQGNLDHLAVDLFKEEVG